jgi:prepilin-type N-terminal cleavage/methylation domain-containing protein
MGSLNNKRGLTLIELVTVVAVIGFLLASLGFAFQGWLAKYKVEDETKRFYSDLMDARARAMQKKRVTFVDLATNRYRTFEDPECGGPPRCRFGNHVEGRITVHDRQSYTGWCHANPFRQRRPRKCSCNDLAHIQLFAGFRLHYHHNDENTNGEFQWWDLPGKMKKG